MQIFFQRCCIINKNKFIQKLNQPKPIAKQRKKKLFLIPTHSITKYSLSHSLSIIINIFVLLLFYIAGLST